MLVGQVNDLLSFSHSFSKSSLCLLDRKWKSSIISGTLQSELFFLSWSTYYNIRRRGGRRQKLIDQPGLSSSSTAWSSFNTFIPAFLTFTSQSFTCSILDFLSFTFYSYILIIWYYRSVIPFNSNKFSSCSIISYSLNNCMLYCFNSFKNFRILLFYHLEAIWPTLFFILAFWISNLIPF